MIGATAKAEQFYTRSGSEATKGSRKGFSLLGGGVNPSVVLSEREERESRQTALRAKLKVELAELALAKQMVKDYFGKGDAYFKWRAEKERATKEVMGTTEALSAIKKEYLTGKPRSLETCFMDLCRESMTKAQFRLLLDEAFRRARAAEDKSGCA
jgi:hypothetical protein